MKFDFKGFLIRLVGSMIVLALANILTPSMSNNGGIFSLALIAIVIAIVSHLFAEFLGLSRTGNGISGFLVTSIVLYVSGLLLNSFDVTIIGALIGGLIYGIVDFLIPTKKL